MVLIEKDAILCIEGLTNGPERFEAGVSLFDQLKEVAQQGVRSCLH